MRLSLFRRILSIAGAGAMLVAMTTVLPATATPARVRAVSVLQLTVSPKDSAWDAPLTISISGVKPGQRVTLSVTSVDCSGVKWSSSSTYAAGPSGTVNPATSPAVPALGGSYFGLDPMGPIDFMSTAANPGSVYCWTPSKPRSFVFSVTSGQAHSSVTVQRGPALPVTWTSETVAADGFYGTFWQPPTGQSSHVAILQFTGSSGGMIDFGAMFASRGYPPLDLAYFGAPGLPQQLKDIPLEYFAKALTWLARHPGVDPKRIWVMGWSAGSEAALLLGIHYSKLVHGVVAIAPSDVANCAWWTFDGRPVPCTNQFGIPHPTDRPAAVIPVRKIRGPVFLSCGVYDQNWDSCPSSETMMTELAAAHDTYPHELLRYPDAGHGIGLVVPHLPGFATISTQAEGADMVSNPVAVANQWPRLLAFLQ